MTRITIMRGLPASGKSGLAKEMVADNPNLVRVNRDAIRWTQGTFPFGTPEQEEMVSVIEEALVVGAIKAGKDVVIDATHLNGRSLTKWFKIARAYGVHDVAILSLEVPIAELFERDANRQKSVGQAVIAKMAKRYKIGDDGKLPKGPQWGTGANADLTPAPAFDPELPNAIIVDTDGTMANHVGIRNPYDTSRYHLDTLHEDVARIIWSLEMTHMVIGVSGRDAKFADVTKQWWREHARINPDEFYFRPEGDTRPDDVIKAEIYEQHLRGRYNIIGVFDDRARVLAIAVGDTRNNEF